MNKYQKALNFLDWHCEVSHVNEQELLQELVDKETPMKPINNKYEITLLDKILGTEQTYTCPRCRNACLEMLATNKRNINRYCYDCGQKIDWSNNE